MQGTRQTGLVEHGCPVQCLPVDQLNSRSRKTIKGEDVNVGDQVDRTSRSWVSVDMQNLDLAGGVLVDNQGDDEGAGDQVDW